MKIEIYLYLDSWAELENFVRYQLPHSEYFCILTTGDVPNPKTYILILNTELSWIIKQHFDIVPSKIDTAISYKNWFWRGNKNLLPEEFL